MAGPKGKSPPPFSLVRLLIQESAGDVHDVSW
jgi:hypothetical protein